MAAAILILAVCGLLAGLPMIIMSVSRALAVVPLHLGGTVRLMQTAEHLTLAIAASML